MLKNIKYQIALCLVLLWSGFASAGNIMQINSAQVQANQQVSIQIVITNSDPFVAFQLDVPLPAPFAYVANSAALNPARCNGQMISATLMTGNILRIIGFSFNNTPFLGNSGVIATFALNAGTIPGDYILTPTNAIIGNASSVNILTGVVSGTLTLLAPNINLNPVSLDFGQIPLGNTSDQYVTVSNTGNQNLQISNITFNSPYFTVVGNTAFSIPPNGSSTVTVRFTSTVKGTYQKTMTIVGNDPDQASSTVALQAVAFAVNELHCGNMFAYSGNQANLSLSINNMEAFTGFQFDLQLPSPLAYLPGSIQLTNRKTNHLVSANVLSENVLRIIAYSPSNQPFSGNNGDVVTMSFSVNGAGGWYPLNLNNVIIGNSNGQNIVSASYNGYLEIAAANIWCDNNLNFGDVSILDTARQTLRVYNYGNDTLKVSQLQFTNTVFFSDITLPFRVNQWEYADIPVKFHPATKGQTNGMMKIFSNDPDENPKNISLSGNGFIPNYLSVMDTSCFKSDTVTVQVSAENYEPFVGFQFDISFPASMSYIPNSVTLTNRAQGHMVQASLINSTTLRVVAFSMQQLPFLGNSGAVVNLGFAVNVTGTENTLPLTLSNAIMGNSQSQNILYGTNDGAVQIIEISISGSFNYNNTQNTPLGAAEVSLLKNGVIVGSTTTDNSGNYLFEHCSKGNYSIMASTQLHWAGVSCTDALLIQRYIAGLSYITLPIRLHAADVNNTNTISATDVLKIKRRIVCLDTSFTRPDWLFEKPNGGNTFTAGRNNVIQNFYGLCTGDVNGSNIPGASIKISAINQLTNKESLVAGKEQIISLPVHLQSAKEIGAIDLAISYPQELVSIKDVKARHGEIIYHAQNGILRITWSELNPLLMNESDVLLTITVKTSSAFTDNEKISFSILPESELADEEANIIPDIKISLADIYASSITTETTCNLYPNPGNDYLMLTYFNKKNGSTMITVTIYNAIGENKSTQENYTIVPGNNTIKLNTSHLESGMYILKITNNAKEHVSIYRKFIISK